MYIYGGATTTVVARATVCQKIPYISQGNVAIFQILCDHLLLSLAVKEFWRQSSFGEVMSQHIVSLFDSHWAIARFLGTLYSRCNIYFNCHPHSSIQLHCSCLVHFIHFCLVGFYVLFCNFFINFIKLAVYNVQVLYLMEIYNCHRIAGKCSCICCDNSTFCVLYFNRHFCCFLLPLTSSSSKITDRSFWYASRCLRVTFYQRPCSLSSSHSRHVALSDREVIPSLRPFLLLLLFICWLTTLTIRQSLTVSLLAWWTHRVHTSFPSWTASFPWTAFIRTRN